MIGNETILTIVIAVAVIVIFYLICSKIFKKEGFVDDGVSDEKK